jgi:hypothetical protein
MRVGAGVGQEILHQLSGSSELKNDNNKLLTTTTHHKPFPKMNMSSTLDINSAPSVFPSINKSKIS